jgi:hypothetical protein
MPATTTAPILVLLVLDAKNDAWPWLAEVYVRDEKRGCRTFTDREAAAAFYKAFDGLPATDANLIGALN